MTTVNIDPWVHDRIQPNFACRNGQIPSATFQSQVSQLTNQLMRLRPKEHFSMQADLAELTGECWWNWQAHVSPMCGTLVIRMLLSKSPATGGAYANYYIADTTDATLAAGTIYGGTGTGETLLSVPEEWTEHTVLIDAREFVDTTIRGTIWTPFSGGGGVTPGAISGILIAATIYESPAEPDTDNGYLSQGFHIGQGIYEADRQAIAEAAVSMWKRQAAPLIAWSANTAGTAPTNATTTWKNIYDNSTSVTQNSPGYWVDLRYCHSRMRSTVPCVFAALIGTSSAGTHNIRLVDSAGSVLATISGAPASFGTWFSTTVNLPPTLQKIDIQFQSDGANTLTAYAVNVYQYLA